MCVCSRIVEQSKFCINFFKHKNKNNMEKANGTGNELANTQEEELGLSTTTKQYERLTSVDMQEAIMGLKEADALLKELPNDLKHQLAIINSGENNISAENFKATADIDLESLGILSTISGALGMGVVATAGFLLSTNINPQQLTGGGLVGFAIPAVAEVFDRKKQNKNAGSKFEKWIEKNAKAGLIEAGKGTKKGEVITRYIKGNKGLELE